jgi:hypothetical protein
VQQEAGMRLLSGDIAGFINFGTRGIEKAWRYCRMRDAVMAQGLIPAEAYLRSIYPSLNQHKIIRLTMGIGALHYPEEHLRLPSKVVILCPLEGFDTGSIDHRMRKEWSMNGRISENDVLAYGAALLEKNGKAPNPVTSRALEKYKHRHAAQ